MIDVFKDLQRLSWRGIEVPVSARSVSFTHDDVRHKFQFRDNEIIEATGAQNLTFSYTIPFRQGIAKGPYKDLFIKTLADFYLACRDRSTAELVDPVLGSFNAKCTSFNDDTDVTKRDGDDVRVEFVHAPGLDEIEGIFGGILDLQGVATDAGALERELAKQAWEQDDPGAGLVNPLQAINGLARQVQRQGNKMSAALDEIASQCEAIETTLQQLEDPRNFGAEDSSRKLRDASIRLKERAEDPSRTIRTVTQSHGTSLARIAADAGMTIEELLDLNPELARKPFIPPFTKVRLYA